MATLESQHAIPTSPTERALAEVLAGVVPGNGVSVESHFFDDLGADSMVMAQFCARVRKRADLPSVSMKDIYQHPTIKSLAASLTTSALIPCESALVEVLSGVIQVNGVTVESHFFDDLGADSMVMAQFCARVRKRADLPSISMKDIYQHPTIKSLAAALADRAPTPLAKSPPARTFPASTPTPEVAVPATVPDAALADSAPTLPAEAPPTRNLPAPTPPTTTAAPPSVGTGHYVVCGMLQLLTFFGYCWLYVAIATQGYLWVAAGTGIVDIYLRSVLYGGGTFVGLGILPIVAKWVLVGRWKRQQIRVWSLGYFRFWLVKTLIRANPFVRIMVGSPWYVLYLRALGARVGKGVAIFTPSVPVCTDLLTIGDGTVIRKGASLSCYRAHAGLIEIGAVTLGREVVISEATVLDIETSMGDRAQLGHASSLHSGQAVTAGERWHGSPAQRTEVDYRAVDPTDCGTLRRVLYPLSQLLSLVLVSLPLVIGGAVVLVAEVPQIPALLYSAELTPAGLSFYLEALVASFLLLSGGLLVGLLLVGSLPRLLNLAIEPDKVYPLYGIHYILHRRIARLTNVRIFTYLFGDSSYIVYYLRYIGYNLNKVVQTGSNFGTAVVHESPYLSAVGSGTVVADGLSINNADYSSTSFRVSQTTIGAHSFLGNAIAYPSQAKTGDNCLLATKAMIPVDGKFREGVGLLGSPSFEIPRSVLRDTSLDVRGPEELSRRLAAKNKHNLATLALALLVRWMHLYAFTMLAMLVTDLYRRFGLVALVAELFAATLFTLAYFIFVERAATGFRPLRPQYCSIYDRYFWWHERFWKLAVQGLDRRFTGTPFKNIVSRLLGVRIGKRVFDDGCSIPEKTLATVGDDCTLNAGSTIQCHSQEDGAFKSDYSTIGSGCTVGVGAWVHYGVTMGDGAVLAPDSFLMKGEQVPQQAEWGGNPAAELPDGGSDLTVGGRATPSLPPNQEHRGEPVPLRSGRTRVRRLVGAAAVFLLLSAAVVYYREAPSIPSAGSGPRTTDNPSAGAGPITAGPSSAIPGGESPSAGRSPAPDARGPTSAPTPGAGDRTSAGSAGRGTISVANPAGPTKPFQTVRITGTYAGRAGTFLRVQRWEAGKWLTFPLPTRTDQSGRFTTYVDLGPPGRYELRLLDPASGVASKPFVLVIRR